MYETVIWVAFMSGIFSLVLELIYKKKFIALAGALVSTMGLVLADQLPLALDPKINPLVPVLRSNFWLTIHVLVIVSSYAGGTLAWALGNIGLFLIVFGKGSHQATIKLLSAFTYRALQIAVLLLAAGTFLGGWWAAYSWGRFWGWDPKETGALIALLCYVIPLHMRYIGWIKDFGLAVAAILCYAAILISWYGVNFVFPAGLHSYGTGSGGAWWVYLACFINIEWVMVATLIYWRKQTRPVQVLAAPGAASVATTLPPAAANEHGKE
jgi:ABC-type transport system involved in cytochrome c biogenesis permease subunit